MKILQNSFTIAFIYFFLALSSQLYSNEKYNLEVQKKYTFSICGVFKNEEKHLKEWIDYHQQIGAEHFYLYNLNSDDSFEFILKPYIRKGIVTLVNWPEINPMMQKNYQSTLIKEIPAYENAINFLAKNETDWLAILNINEYLVCDKQNILEVLEKYKDFPGIEMNVEMFDEIETLPDNSHTLSTDQLISKMIFKPENCAGFTYPPYKCLFKNTSTASINIHHKEMCIKRYIQPQISTKNKKERFFQSNFNYVQKPVIPMYSRPIDFLQFQS